MSDTEHNGSAVGRDESIGGMTSADVKFLVTCLKNTTGGSIAVDYNKVADTLGFKNPKSVANKITIMKKKFDLPIGTSGKGSATPDKAKAPTPRKASDAAGPKDPAVPKTPFKARVTKPRASSGTKSKATPKGKKPKSDDEDEDMEPATGAAASKEPYEEIFGQENQETGDAEDEDEDHDAYAP